VKLLFFAFSRAFSSIAGDVAQAPDFFAREKVNNGLWPSAVEQGEIAGKNMAGLKEEYPGNLKMNVTRVFAIPIASVGSG
jgi:NADPH-dependent 2,4-dienoyl-CoA reductase/sulfur reductase-like enzyme